MSAPPAKPETPAALERRRLRALGAALARYQDAAGLPAEELGRLAGLSARQVRRVRQGGNLSASSLFAICDALGLDLCLYQPQDRARLRHPGGRADQLVAVTDTACERIERALGKLDKQQQKAVRLLPAILGRLSAEERRALLGF